MALPGSQLARAVLDNLGLSCYKLYTQQRKKDRTYKIWGVFSKPDADAIIQRLTACGARNARVVISGYTNRYISGVRFEY